MLRKLAAWTAGLGSAAIALTVVGWFSSAPLKAQLAAPDTWAGTATGLVNSPSIAIHNVAALADLLGVTLRFLPSGANTGTTTLTIRLDNGGTLGPINIQKPGLSSGLVPLIGNEFQPNQIAAVTYDGTQFECGNCLTTVPAGTVQDFSGVTIPSGWLKADGSAVSRTAQPVLFNALAFTSVSATTTNTNTSVVVSSSSNFQVGWFVGGSNVSCNSTITAIPDGTHITLNAGATASGATTLTIGPYQQGDCSTTFNLPNYTGRTLAGVDGSSVITSATCTNAASIGDKSVSQPCGQQQSTLATTNLPPYTPSGTVASSSTTTGTIAQQGFAQTGTQVNGGASLGSNNGGVNPQNWLTASTTTTSTFSGIAQGGASTAFTNLPPIALVYKIIKT